MDVSTIGLDIAKSVFQVHGIDAAGDVVVRRRLRRRQLLGFEKLGPCLVGIEACATAHYWGREIAALGHEPHPVRLHNSAKTSTGPVGSALKSKGVGA